MAWDHVGEVPGCYGYIAGISRSSPHWLLDIIYRIIQESLENSVLPFPFSFTAPIDPIEVSSCVNTSAEFTDQNTTDTHTAIWDWGDSTTSQGVVNETGGSGTVTGNHEYSNPGVYTVILTVIDDDGNSDSSEFRYIVVYDPEGGFATGGGWINSPEGAYAPDPTLEDKANFGFVSKYKKGADVPTGQTEFNFKVADLNFHSDSYDWLVVAGANAKYKGVGTINSSGNYGFMLTAKDAGVTPPPDDVDEFRIKIWDKDDGDVVVYDNKPGEADDSYAGTEISGGNIKIHDPKAAPMDEPLPEDNCALAPFPNPSNPEVWIPYQLNADNQVAIHIYDVKGRLVRKLDFRYKPAGFYTDKSKAAYWDGKNEAGEHVASGVYFYTIQAGDFTATKKMVVTR